MGTYVASLIYYVNLSFCVHVAPSFRCIYDMSIGTLETRQNVILQVRTLRLFTVRFGPFTKPNLLIHNDDNCTSIHVAVNTI